MGQLGTGYASRRWLLRKRHFPCPPNRPPLTGQDVLASCVSHRNECSRPATGTKTMLPLVLFIIVRSNNESDPHIRQSRRGKYMVVESSNRVLHRNENGRTTATHDNTDVRPIDRMLSGSSQKERSPTLLWFERKAEVISGERSQSTGSPWRGAS